MLARKHGVAKSGRENGKASSKKSGIELLARLKWSVGRPRYSDVTIKLFHYGIKTIFLWVRFNGAFYNP